MRVVSKSRSLFFLVVFFSILNASSALLAQSSPENNKEETQPAEGSKEVPVVYSNNPVLAEVDGQLVTVDDLKNAQTHEMMERLHQQLNDALKQKTLNLLASSHPELAPARAEEVTESDIVKFYNNEPGIKDLGPLDQLRTQIRNFLEKRRRQLAFKDVDEKFKKAVDRGWVVNYFKPPNDFHLKARVGTAMLWFNGENATGQKVFVMEYSDFLCPFCRKVQTTLKELRQKYTGKVQFGYRHFPIHQEARDLSEAVECARDQGRFWQFQNLVFSDARRLQKNKMELILNARRAGVRDIPSFEKCMDSRKYADRVQKDFEEGASLGIQGTPTFIIGRYDSATSIVDGEMFSGAVPPDKFIVLIEKYLKLTQE